MAAQGTLKVTGAGGDDDKKEEEEEEVGNVRAFFLGAFACSKRCLSVVLQGSPVDVCEEVDELLKHHGITAAHLYKIYCTFLRLKQSEDDNIVREAHEVECESVQQLVQERRRWVARLLRCLLTLGGCELDATVTWDEFLWIFIRFNSLSEPELGQTLFMIILSEVESSTLHYLTREQLSEYYVFYEKCPFKSFNTRYINFERLPWSRYYVSDFCELCVRFRQLLNPIIHLQQQLQNHLPSLDFWDDSDHTEFTRKITLEFFTMKRIRVFLRGDPPFRETCDMLAPDALGTEPLNQDQWYLRVWGLKQWSVWGEQYTPEKAEEREAKFAAAKAAADAEAARREALIKEAIEQGLPPPKFPDKPKVATAAEVPPDAGQLLPGAVPPPNGTTALLALPGPPVPGQPRQPGLAAPPGGGTVAQHLAAQAQAQEQLQPGSQQASTLNGQTRPAAQAPTQVVMAQPGAAQAIEPVPFAFEPQELALRAITDNEDLLCTERPLPWMRDSTVAPAPRRRGADPPLWKLEQMGVPYQETPSWYLSPTLNEALGDRTFEPLSDLSPTSGDFSLSMEVGVAVQATMNRTGGLKADVAVTVQGNLSRTGGINAPTRRVSFDDGVPGTSNAPGR